MSDATKAMRDTTYAWRMVDRLSSENAMLREQADFEHFQLGEMKRAVGMMLDEYDELANGVTILAAENERLCELIKKVWKWEKNGCFECPLERDCKVLCVYDGDCGIAVEVEKELQELGIEVD